MVVADRSLRTFVGERDGQAGVEEGQFLEALRQRGERVAGGLEDVRVGHERNRGAVSAAFLVPCQGGERGALLVRLGPAVAVSSVIAED